MEVEAASPLPLSGGTKVTPRRFAGLALDRPRLMGIVNVTPDSFSDGGQTLLADAAIGRGFALVAAGADIVDVGGESSRPGAEPVPVDEELARVVPVVKALACAGLLVSIDTRRSRVMAAAIDAGAAIVNDITGLRGDADALPLVAAAGVSVVVMHMQGEPRTMQRRPSYEDPVREVHAWLAGRVAACRAAGIALDRIAVDPGIGFGKTLAHNLEILANLGAFRGLAGALLIGVSRKSFIARLSRGEPPEARLPGSIAAGLDAVAAGADILRVHDVCETHQALSVQRAIAGCRLGANGMTAAPQV